MTISLLLRAPVHADVPVAGRICHDAFRAISTQHGFPPDFPSPEVAIGFFSYMFSRPDVHGVIAEIDGQVAGSNFLWEGDPVAGVGPITVEPAIRQGVASVVERRGQISGYTTGIGFFGHAVAETTDDLKALIAAAPSFSGPGFLLPIRHSVLFRWCLEQGLRVVQPLTLMSIGPYQEPRGAYLPSILY